MVGFILIFLFSSFEASKTCNRSLKCPKIELALKSNKIEANADYKTTFEVLVNTDCS